MGVILWYKVDFPILQVTVSNDVHTGSVLADAEITVQYAFRQAGRFDISFSTLPLEVHKALATALGERDDPQGGVDIDIHLGYLDDPSARQVVLSGRVGGITSSTRYQPLGVRLIGLEEAAHRLTTRVDPEVKPRKARLDMEDTTPAKAARHIAALAGVDTVGEDDPCAYTRDMKNSAPNAFDLLVEIAEKYGDEILVQNGAVQYGTAITYPPETGFGSIPDLAAIAAAIGGEDCLLALKTMTVARMAEFKPTTLLPVGRQNLETDDVAQAEVDVFDFTVLGEPALRAGQLVAAGVEGYEKPFQDFRVLDLTHAFSTRSGYTCRGRAVRFGKAGNARRSELARKATPRTIADLISGKAREQAAVNPSVDVGRIAGAKPEKRLVTVDSGQEPDVSKASPSVDVEIGNSDPRRRDKPIASPFAWHKVGLSVPVYEGMRALLNQVRDNPDDTVVAGFLWANEPDMERPKAEEHDWWLCLPTALGAGPAAKPTGAGVNDLIAGDGRRVVEAVGLKIAVGKSICSPVGERPEEGAADVFLLTHKSGTTVTIDDTGKVTVDGGTQDVVLKAGGSTVTVGKEKVAIDGGLKEVTVSAGGATLTVAKGKVAIS
ncbi:hypothetical protein ACFQ9Q_11820 [Streptomyces virginiae]|uniref:hypothetical protein n=1 Tax=Streptomyces virginiae TaxID=1961 RepID=UPI0036A94746